MTIFSRYVFRQTSSALLLVLLSLVGIVWISLALRELNVVTSQGQSGLTLIKMTTLGLPSFIAVITPFALLITAIHTLNRLNSDSEIIVLTASGATAWTITKPLMTLALLITAFLTFINHLAAPWSQRQLRDLVLQVRTDLLTQVIQPGRFSSPEKGLTFHIRERQQDGTLRGLVMHDMRDPKKAQSYLADKGVLVEDNGGTYLFMMDGHILSRDGDITEPTQIIAFDKYAVDLNSMEKKRDGPQELRARERFYSELVNPDPAEKTDATERGRFRSELHERFSGALYPIAFVLLAIAMVGQAQSTRQNRHVRMGVCFLLGVGLRLGGLAFNNIVTINPTAVPVLYLIPIAAIGAALVLIVQGARFSTGPAFLDRIGDLVTTWWGQIRQRFSRRRGVAAAQTGS
ncbi:LPS export ABC transporter permease LptF [Hyphomicrobium sp.]|uniref:LPS export ABC transporter permease LptF n=1 Tax=Hyphomicrobium sp. TaxID=82 RepID=UPI002E311DD1|nr:LPS export ABC transporter permease LptF [Hyphomicrobium sp.]HEX2843042.1 LPS export ABC transporter permease LptF [Hyphomicrobium sp.]